MSAHSSLIAAALADQRKGPDCRSGQWVLSLSKADRAEVEEAFAASEIQHAALARAIKARWAEAPSAESLTRHRKGECACAAR